MTHQPVHSKRKHRKSRAGCFNCKRRKVKCDEEKPRCQNCVRFAVLCEYDGEQCTTTDRLPTPSISAMGTCTITTPRKGRGRPRKLWPGIVSTEPTSSPEINISTSAPDDLSHSGDSVCSHSVPVTKCTEESSVFALSMEDLELLLHFTTCTAKTLGEEEADPFCSAWATVAPRVGLNSPFLLNMLMSFSARHLLYLETASSIGPAQAARRGRLTDLALKHFAVGLSETRRVAALGEPESPGALYLSSMLVNYCMMAAGPAGPDDLLVCHAGTELETRVPIIQGTRMLRAAFSSDELFSGIMSAFSENKLSYFEQPQPHCVTRGFPRLGWTEPLERVRHFIQSEVSDRDTVVVCLRALTRLESIFEALYGDAEGSYSGPPHLKIVFVWLYQMDERFVVCLQQKQHAALLILAHFATILDTLHFWFVRGWTKHLLDRISAMTDGRFATWLPWALQQRR